MNRTITNTNDSICSIIFRYEMKTEKHPILIEYNRVSGSREPEELVEKDMVAMEWISTQ